MGRVLVIGAAGFIGRHIVHALVKDGNDVVAQVRSEAKARSFDGLPVQCVAADIANLDAMVRLGKRSPCAPCWT